MKTCPHCRKIAPQTGDNDNPLPPASRRRRSGEIAGWIIPGVTLALLPKCPICVAAYVALFSGISITIASASHLRTSLQIVCIAVLILLLLRRLYRLASRNKEAKFFIRRFRRFVL